jgi:formamidopyrimidine-DNA glycosylase
MDLMARSALADHPWFRSLGVEPTGNSLDAHELAGRLAGKTAPLKAALARPAHHRGPGKHICLRGAVAGGPVTSQAGRQTRHQGRDAAQGNWPADQAISAT